MKKTRLIWKCEHCNDVVVSYSFMPHRMDICNCRNTGVDLEEFYERHMGNPVTISRKIKEGEASGWVEEVQYNNNKGSDVVQEVDNRTSRLYDYTEPLSQEVDTKPSEALKPTPEERLLELLKGTVRTHDFDKYKDTATCWLKDGKVVMQERKNGLLLVNYGQIWEVLEKEYDLKYKEIQALIANTVEKHFNCNGLTPSLSIFVTSGRWRNTSIARG